ncbi:MFS transporter [Actinomadura sp. 7K507]|uniref:MFS transporter n=1 Tax=Actinomadura sp. 7K507 TaxID=2530365 RepID=UPI001A9D813D|nr:MFS transporter [Actinomadura sp. 7K507]
MSSAPEPPAPAVPMRRLLLVLVPAMLLNITAADMVSLVLPRISEQFTASTAQVAWVVTGFLLMFAVGVPFYGRVADRYGLRRLFTVVLAIFAVGSLISALSPSLPILVFGRIVMGLGGAAVPVLAIVAVMRLLPGDKAAVGVGFVSAAAGVGTAAGPAMGGIVGEFLGWPALFWIMAAGALILIPAVRRAIAEEPPGDPGPFDLAGGVLLGLAAGLLLFGVTESEGGGFSRPSSWGSILGGVVLAGLFAWRNRVAAHPFVPPSLFGNRAYVAAVLTVFTAMAVNLATLVLVPVLIIDVNGLTPGQGSLVMIPGGIALALLAPLAGRIGAQGRHATRVLLAGLTVMGLATLFLSTIAAGASHVLVALAILGLDAGFAFVITLTTGAVSSVLPPQHVGAGVGIFQGAQFLGAGAGPALFGALLTARESGGGDAVNPFYAGDAPAYSDVFLALTLIVLLAMIPAFNLRTAWTTRTTTPTPRPAAHAR